MQIHSTGAETTGTNKALARRFYDEFYGLKDPAVMDEIFSPEYVHHFPDVLGKKMDFADFKRRKLQLIQAFPGLEVAVDDQIAEGDRVVTYATIRGTQENDLPNIPATGKKIDVSTMVIHRFAGGRIVEGWELYDSLGMMMQLDVIHMVSTLSRAQHERGGLPQHYEWPE